MSREHYSKGPRPGGKKAARANAFIVTRHRPENLHNSVSSPRGEAGEWDKVREKGVSSPIEDSGTLC